MEKAEHEGRMELSGEPLKNRRERCEVSGAREHSPGVRMYLSTDQQISTYRTPCGVTLFGKGQPSS
jgi:hypothetical protein